MDHWHVIAAAIATATGAPFRAETQRAVGGGCINETYVIEGEGRRYFIKLNRADAIDMFSAEAEGLIAIIATNTVRAPQPICWGSAGGRAYLALEYLPFGRERAAGMALLGAQLAALHRHTQTRYGWHRDNTIGSTPQLNRTADDWIMFWREQRLHYQLQCAARRGLSVALRKKGDRLLAALDGLLGDHRPPASLLHGDLWSGNQAVLADGQPVIYDPALYYGDRETDLAMTELFGGFGAEFYAAYHEHYPLEEGYARRKLLYNLYHVLNHYNLFGGSYAAQAERMIDSLLNEAG